MGLKPKEGIQVAPAGQHIILTTFRIQQLESLGFEWVNLDST
jgi:hypothetical protein